MWEELFTAETQRRGGTQGEMGRVRRLGRACLPRVGAQRRQRALRLASGPDFRLNLTPEEHFAAHSCLVRLVADPWPSLLFTTCPHPFFHTGPYREKVTPRRSF